MIRREFIGLVSAVCLSVSPFVARAQRSTGENGLSWRLILVRRPDFAFMFSLRCARFSYVKPSSGIFSTEPHALQCTASLSWRCRPQVGQGNRTLLGVNSARARLKNRVTPKIMMTTDIRRPTVPGRVMSPKPVVVSAVTVKYSASA